MTKHQCPACFAQSNPPPEGEGESKRDGAFIACLSQIAVFGLGFVKANLCPMHAKTAENATIGMTHAAKMMGLTPKPEGLEPMSRTIQVQLPLMKFKVTIRGTSKPKTIEAASYIHAASLALVTPPNLIIRETGWAGKDGEFSGGGRFARVELVDVT